MQKEDFIAYLTFEKRFSGNTIQAYRTDLKEFSEFLEKNYKFSDISSVDHTLIRSWLVELYRQHNSPRTINRKISCLKSFFRFCIREGLLTASPMNKVISPKAPKPLPEFLSRENLKTLLNDVNFGTGYEAVRNKLIILLFYCTGIRCSELTNLKTGDLDAGNQTIRVMGKRSKERIIPVGKEIIEFYHEYILIRGKFLTEISDIRQPGEEFLFLSNLGKAIYTRMVYRIVHTYLSIVASNNRLSPHVLRHTFATHMLDNGADLNAIKEILGHSSLAATQVYTHNTIEKLKSIHKQAHPRA